MPANVIVLRGVPGSGKSTLQAKNWPNADVCSADHFFMHGSVYEFDGSKLADAHGQCMRDFINLCRNSIVESLHCIVVDNTGIQLIDIAPYVAIAQAYKLPVQIITVMCDCDADVAAKRCTHGVPETAVKRMAVALEEQTKQIPRRWAHSLYISE